MFSHQKFENIILECQLKCSLTNVLYVEFELEEAKMAKLVLKARSSQNFSNKPKYVKIGRLEPEFLRDKKLQLTLTL
jgi:hypothetical protein